MREREDIEKELMIEGHLITGRIIVEILLDIKEMI